MLSDHLKNEFLACKLWEITPESPIVCSLIGQLIGELEECDLIWPMQRVEVRMVSTVGIR